MPHKEPTVFPISAPPPAPRNPVFGPPIPPTIPPRTPPRAVPVYLTPFSSPVAMEVMKRFSMIDASVSSFIASSFSFGVPYLNMLSNMFAEISSLALISLRTTFNISSRLFLDLAISDSLSSFERNFKVSGLPYMSPSIGLFVTILLQVTVNCSTSQTKNASNAVYNVFANGIIKSLFNNTTAVAANDGSFKNGIENASIHAFDNIPTILIITLMPLEKTPIALLTKSAILPISMAALVGPTNKVHNKPLCNALLFFSSFTFPSTFENTLLNSVLNPLNAHCKSPNISLIKSFIYEIGFAMFWIRSEKLSFIYDTRFPFIMLSSNLYTKYATYLKPSPSFLNKSTALFMFLRASILKLSPIASII
ncbi:MAG: hypothetical protein BWY47_01714 [Bacteroidetes bacterium ADurb.Bin302]|nr:MAG: hypothetical protein BWY47_01714 [Bacteroidetes bacterium ADurb.Bin302]